MSNISWANNPNYYNAAFIPNRVSAMVPNSGQNWQYQNNTINVNRDNQLISPSKLNNAAIYTTWKNPNTLPISPNDSTLTILHVNDNHGNVKGLTQFKTAFNEITQKVKNAGVDLLKVHSGDYGIGRDATKLKLQIELLNDMGIQYAALGNHEFDINPVNLAKQLQNAKFVSLAANLKIPPGCGIDKLWNSGKIVASTIYQTNGHKYGLIGLSPPDLIKRLDPDDKMFGVDALPESETIKKVQEEINKLRSQGINKILLLSHVGVDLDKKIVKATDGIDIILSGHSHELLDPLETGVSIEYSASKEPVLIFQNGRDGKFFGVTDAIFDEKGIVKAAMARQESAKTFSPDKTSIAIEDQILGSSPVIGTCTNKHSVYTVKMRENPVANFIADSVRAKTGADIALFQSFAVRDSFPKGQITERKIDDMLPFIDSVHVLKVSGQDVIDALTHGAKTYVRPDKRPGILQVSGLKYTISSDGNATNVLVSDKNNQYSPIDPSKEYNVACDQYLIKGAEGFKSLAQPTSVIKAYLDSNADVVKQAIKSLNNQPLVLKNEGRITVLAKEPGNTGEKLPKAMQKPSSNPKAGAQIAQQQPQNISQQTNKVMPQPQMNTAYRFPIYPNVPPTYYVQQPFIPAPIPSYVRQ